jgi:hypothetical protein
VRDSPTVRRVSKPSRRRKASSERFQPWHREFHIVESRHPLYPFVRFHTPVSHDAPLRPAERRHWEELYLLVIVAGIFMVIISR